LLACRRALVLTTLLVAGVGLASCRSSMITGPLTATAVSTINPTVAVPPAPEPAPVDTIHAMVPEVTNLTTEVRGGTLYVRGMVKSRSRFYAPFYAPATNGGWSLQLFVDTEPMRSVYWMGFDYVVRGVEFDAARRTFVTRHITLDADTPGGWGPASGTAAFTQRSMRTFEIAVPLESIRAIDGNVAFCLETYATVECPACDGGLTQEFADDYFGTITDTRSHAPVAVAMHPLGLSALARPQAGHTANADARLVPHAIVAER
jgi:hypothetical protein